MSRIFFSLSLLAYLLKKRVADTHFLFFFLSLFPRPDLISSVRLIKTLLCAWSYVEKAFNKGFIFFFIYSTHSFVAVVVVIEALVPSIETFQQLFSLWPKTSLNLHRL